MVSATPEPTDSWTNTHAQAVVHARRWVDTMRTEGFVDIEMTGLGVEVDGCWLFEIRHVVTDVVVHLEHHGIDNLDEYLKRNSPPRVYWNGSSGSEPALSDFAAVGFAPVKVMTFVRQ